MPDQKNKFGRKIWNWRLPVRNKFTTILGLCFLAAAIVLMVIYYLK